MTRAETTIVLFSTADWKEPYWTNKQHTAKVLSNLGYSVIYVESIGLRAPKIGSSKDIRRILNRVYTGLQSLVCGADKQSDKLVVLSPLVLPNPKNYQLIKKLNSFILNFLIKRELARFCNNYLIAWTYHPFVQDVVDKMEFDKIIYHSVDDLSKIPGIEESNFNSHEERLLNICDHVFVTTKSLEKRCSKINESVHYHSNVVDFGHFSNSNKSTDEKLHIVRKSKAKKVIYHGVLSDFKVDFKLLFKVASMCHELEFYIIGQEREGQKNNDFFELKSLSNVYHLGYVPYSDLPDFLHLMDVGILPTLLNEYTDSMFPMKFYEYVAAGLPVVSTKLNFTEYTKNEAISVSDSYEVFAENIRRHIEQGKLDARVAKEIIGDNTWIGRTKKMLAIIEGSD
ncbi:glycosyltransferase [Vibrio maerlii]|uniref:glycosyltransferase n=1 Tax=Vibrio maerlii TaxID=2231648 RepID=UPI0013DF5784|nr:glycosyltransferase [Vibrio maerlii]